MAQSLGNCPTFSRAQLRIKNLAISLSAMTCFILTLVILVLLVLYRSYKTLLQRLFLYLTIIILVHQAFISLDIQLQFDWKYNNSLCEVQGFIQSWTSTSIYLIIAAITAQLMHLVCRQLLKSKSSEKCNCWTSNKIRADTVIVLFCLLLPLTYLWVPFYHGTHGKYSMTCWIKEYHKCNQSAGSYDQIICLSVMRATMMIVIAAILTLISIFCWSSVHYRNNQIRLKLNRLLFC